MTMQRLYWLASYPRSGNTWLRVLLANALYGNIASTEQVARLVPNIHSGFIERRPTQGEAVVIKTHWPYSADLPYKSETVGAVYLLRHPVDVMASAVRYRLMVRGARALKREPEALRKMARNWVRVYLANRGAPRWVSQGFSRWDLHVQSWLHDCRTIPVHLVRYEDLRDRPQENLAAICSFLGVATTQAALAAAVENSSLARMRELEQQEIENNTRYLFRGAGVAGGAVPDLRFNDGADSESGRAIALTDEEKSAARRVFADAMAEFGYE